MSQISPKNLQSDSVALPVPPTDSIPDTQGDYQEDNSTAIVPVGEQDIQIVASHSNFAVAKQRRIMKTSYTGAEKIAIDALDQRQGVRFMHVQGCYVQRVDEQVVNEKTGEVKEFFLQVLFKLTDGRVVSAGGKVVEQFAREMIEDLGEYDWPEPVLIVVRNHKGKKFDYPTFQVMEVPE